MNADRKAPLKGLRVLVTRARHQADSLANQLKSLGADPICLPMIEILPPENWEELDAAIDKLHEYDWVIFASVNAVEFFCGRLERVWKEPQPRFATIGPATSGYLKRYGLYSSYQAREYVAEAFVRDFPDLDKLSGKKILWPKTNIGRLLIVEQFEAAGAKVDVVSVYRTGLPEDAEAIGEELIELLRGGEIDVVMLASAQTSRNMRAILDMVTTEFEIRLLMGGTTLLAIGPETTRAAEESLFKCDLQAAEYTIDGMIEFLVRQRQRL